MEAHKAEQRDAIDSLLDVMNAEKRWKAERSPAVYVEFLRTFLSAVEKYVHLLAGTDDLTEGTADQAVLATWPSNVLASLRPSNGSSASCRS